MAAALLLPMKSYRLQAQDIRHSMLACSRPTVRGMGTAVEEVKPCQQNERQWEISRAGFATK